MQPNGLPTPFTWDFRGADSGGESGLQSANDGNPFLSSANDGNENLDTANE
jgi:hypothetical protein